MRGTREAERGQKTSRSAARATASTGRKSNKRFSAPVRVNARQRVAPFRVNTWTGAVVFCVIGTPLAILSPQIETYDTTPKLAVLGISAALLLWFSERWWPGVESLWRSRSGRTFYSCLIALAVSLMLSAAFSGGPWVSLAGTVWRRLGAINQAMVLLTAAAIAAGVSSDRTAARALMTGMEAAGGIASIYAILQYGGWDPLIPRSMYTLGLPPAVRPPATLGQATYFATFLLAPILIAATFRLGETSGRWKRLHELTLLVTVAALILSGTRSALLGLGVGACVLLYSERARLVNRKNLVRAAVATGAWLAAFAMLAALPAGKGVRARLVQWTTDRAGGPRLMVWRDSLHLIWQHPAFGIGPEEFENEFRRIESLELARAYPDHYHESPHNLVLEIAIGQGLIGLFAWTALLGVACRAGLMGLREHPAEGRAACAAVFAMLISLEFCPLTLTNELYLLALSATLIAFGVPKAMVAPRATKPAFARVFIRPSTGHLRVP